MRPNFNILLLVFFLGISFCALGQKRNIEYTLNGETFTATVEVNFWLDQNKDGSGNVVLPPMLDLNQYSNAQIIIEVKNLAFDIPEHAGMVRGDRPQIDFSAFRGIRRGRHATSDDQLTAYVIMEIDYQTPFDGPVEGRFRFDLPLRNVGVEGSPIIGKTTINRDYVFIPSPRVAAAPAQREIITTRSQPTQSPAEETTASVQETRPEPQEPPPARRGTEEANALERARQGTLADWQSFVSRYPNSAHVEEIRARIHTAEDREWARANREDRESAYRKYIDLFPTGRYVNMALNKIRSLETQVEEVSVAWDQTRLEGTVESYARFLSEYPDSRYDEEARAQLEFLTEARQARELAGIAPLEAEFTAIADTLFIRNIRGGQPPYFLEVRNREREFIKRDIPLGSSTRDTVINTLDIGLEDGYYAMRVGDARRVDWSASFTMPIRTLRMAGNTTTMLIWILSAMAITALITIAGFKYYLYKKRKEEEDFY